MAPTLQQIVLLDALLTNWEMIRLRMMPISLALQKQLDEIGQKLRGGPSAEELARIIDDLLDLVSGTPAEEYANSMVARTDLGQTTREAGQLAEAAGTSFAPSESDRTATDLGAKITGIDIVTGVQRVPVFFGTNRLPASLAAHAFTGEFQTAITYGVATVTVPVHHKPGELEAPAWWNVFADKKDQAAYFTLSSVMALAQGEFASQLEKAAQTPKPAELLIFLHGYNVTFEEAAMRAAQFAVDSSFDGIVVLFSWPSLGSLLAYLGDEEHAAGSGAVLANFLYGLEKGPWPRVHLLAHSMGNRVLLLGLAEHPRPKLPLGQLVFAAADVFVSDFDEKFSKLQSGGILPATSYASKVDRALKISSKLHHGPRVGLVEECPYMADHLLAIDATNIDGGFLGHGYWSAVPAMLTDLDELLAHGKSPQERKLNAIGGYWTFPGMSRQQAKQTSI
jgi:esterase/lipase superfamily enzyme